MYALCEDMIIMQSLDLAISFFKKRVFASRKLMFV